MASIHEFVVKDAAGEEVSLEKYKDRVSLIVNISATNGLTSTCLNELTELSQKYKDAGEWHVNISSISRFQVHFSRRQGLSILVFPCEVEAVPGEGEELVNDLDEIAANVGDVFEKIDINGDDEAALFTYLKEQQPALIGENCTKVLADKAGQPVECYPPATPAAVIGEKVEELLAQ